LEDSRYRSAGWPALWCGVPGSVEVVAGALLELPLVLRWNLGVITEWFKFNLLGLLVCCGLTDWLVLGCIYSVMTQMLCQSTMCFDWLFWRSAAVIDLIRLSWKAQGVYAWELSSVHLCQQSSGHSVWFPSDSEDWNVPDFMLEI